MTEEPIRFIADENVAKLGRWLRILGYDVAYESPTTDGRLALRARREDRILLTKDSDFIERGMAIHCFMPDSQDPLEQVAEVVQGLQLEPDRERFFSRCVECNVLVSPVSKQEVKEDIPPYVFRTHEHFHRCPSCDRIYWRGSHVSRVQRLFESRGILTQRESALT